MVQHNVKKCSRIISNVVTCLTAVVVRFTILTFVYVIILCRSLLLKHIKMAQELIIIVPKQCSFKMSKNDAVFCFKIIRGTSRCGNA